MGPTSPSTAPPSCAIVVRLKPDDYLAVAGAADLDGRSLAGFVRQLIRERLAA